ncbi:response regulator [Rhodanobacter hydrolyticus]|uniref:histidine kinase n=1 Tax=Rhodanobacter hydrolyticus TaxID=2250595 RepID=A0ABW8J3H4_9GAMM
MNSKQASGGDAVEILVAEDSSTQALSLQYLLEQQGYRVTICQNGRLALAEAKRHKPDLIISDIVMPEMDGYGLCRAVKSDADLNDVPFLLVTTLSNPEDVLSGLEAGADSFILKPYDDTFLLNRVNFVLLHRRLRQSDRADMGVEISFKGRSHFITSNRLQILNLLLSTYEAAIQRNDELRRSEEELREANIALSAVNERLEEEIRQRQAMEKQLAAAKQQAEIANEAKSAFLATMSHEIRTPMNGIVGMVDVLAHSKLSEYQTDAVRTVKESAFALLHLIDDLLDFSKIEAGKLELELTPTSLCDTAEAVCDTLSALADRKGVDLFVFVSPEGPAQVLADPVRLRQIMYNLVGNAIKFSSSERERRGRVDIRVEVSRQQPLQIAFKVSDNGIGIPREARAHLFESFRQAEVSTTRRFGGTGLGLAICKRLVDLMQGEILVDSIPRIGTTFTVHLPFEAVAGAAAPGVPDLSGVEYVIVDGQNARADDLRSYLQYAGAQVTVVTDDEDAVRICADATKPIVLVHGGIDEAGRAAWLDRFDAQPNVHHLLVSKGRRRVARLVSAGVVTMDGNLLRRRSLLHAAAAAAGLASPATEQWRSSSQPEPEASAPTITQARACGQLILVAEDDITNQKVLLRQLNLLGYSAELAKNGREALELWRRGRYAMLLTDLHMPVLDGYGLAAAIRLEEPPQSHSPIIALTANALRGEASRALAAGMDDYLTKPLQLPALRKLLEQWLPPPVTKEGRQDAEPQQTEPAQDRPTLDINVLKNLIGDEPALLYVLLKDFLDALMTGMAAIRKAAAGDDFGEVGAMAHRLKSSSRSVGALQVGDICAELENSSLLGDKAVTVGAVANFEAAAGELLLKLREQLHELESRLDANSNVSGWNGDESPTGRR